MQAQRKQHNETISATATRTNIKQHTIERHDTQHKYNKRTTTPNITNTY